MNSQLDAIAEKIRVTFSNRDAAREKVLPLSRDAIRFCSQAIRSIHRQEFDRARELLDSASEVIKRAAAAAATCEEAGLLGYIRDAQKEYAEGNITLAVVTGREYPTPEELGVGEAAYLNGMGEAAGELRRYLLDGLRRGDLSRGEEILSAMDDIYNVLVTMDFPDAITAGLRRTTDMVRGVLEKTRSDLTLVLRQESLRRRLDEVEGKTKPDG